MTRTSSRGSTKTYALKSFCDPRRDLPCMRRLRYKSSMRTALHGVHERLQRQKKRTSEKSRTCRNASFDIWVRVAWAVLPVRTCQRSWCKALAVVGMTHCRSIKMLSMRWTKGYELIEPPLHKQHDSIRWALLRALNGFLRLILFNGSWRKRGSQSSLSAEDSALSMYYIELASRQLPLLLSRSSE
jgi:hypothetical protein